MDTIKIKLVKKSQEFGRTHNKFYCLVDGLVENNHWAQGVTQEEALGNLLKIECVQKALRISIEKKAEIGFEVLGKPILANI